MRTLKTLWHSHRLLSLAFLTALALTLFLAVRGALVMMPFMQPPPDPPIEGWMTPRLVAHGWHLPPEVLAAALGIELGAARGKTLEDIARAQGLTVDELAARIRAAAILHRALQALPLVPRFAPPPPPPTKTAP